MREALQCVFLVSLVVAAAVASAGCERNTALNDSDVTPAHLPNANESPAPPDAEPNSSGSAMHDPTRPPIDCPLRAKGISPGHMRPFEEVEKYISFLERKDRAAWQKPNEIVVALALEGNETVVDLGAGSGYFTFRLAEALPEGRVVAADIEPEMIRHIHHKVTTAGIDNIDAQLIESSEPSLPDGVDLVFICDVLHHVSDRSGWLRRVVTAVSSGGKLALIEFKEGDLPEGPPESMKIPRDDLVKLATGAGLRLIDEHAQLLPYQEFLVFEKP